MRRSGLLALVASLVLVAGCGTATLLPDGRVLLLNLVAKSYDPATGRVSNLAMPTTVRVYASATLLDGHTSSGIPRATRRSTTAGSSIARTP